MGGVELLLHLDAVCSVVLSSKDTVPYRDRWCRGASRHRGYCTRKGFPAWGQGIQENQHEVMATKHNKATVVLEYCVV